MPQTRRGSAPSPSPSPPGSLEEHAVVIPLRRAVFLQADPLAASCGNTRLSVSSRERQVLASRSISSSLIQTNPGPPGAAVARTRARERKAVGVPGIFGLGDGVDPSHLGPTIRTASPTVGVVKQDVMAQPYNFPASSSTTTISRTIPIPRPDNTPSRCYTGQTGNIPSSRRTRITIRTDRAVLFISVPFAGTKPKMTCPMDEIVASVGLRSGTCKLSRFSR